MTSSDILNKLSAGMYPAIGDNTRRKSQPLYDSITIATGTLTYPFFTSATGNIFLRNVQLPLSGTEIFFCTGVSAFLRTPINTTALVNNLCDLLQRSRLDFVVNGRTICSMPGADYINYQVNMNENATPELLIDTFNCLVRKFYNVITFNSTQNVQINLSMDAATATAFNGIAFDLQLHGVQLDKLDEFIFNDLKDNQLQNVDVTYFNTVAIANGNEATYNFFVDRTVSPLLQNQVFPLSDIQNFRMYGYEFFFGQPDTPIEPGTILQSRFRNVFNINLDNVQFYQSNLYPDKLSVVAAFAGNITTAAADTIAYVQNLNYRKSHKLAVPLAFAPQGKVSITLSQPASSLGVTGDITLMMRGIETRRVV